MTLARDTFRGLHALRVALTRRAPTFSVSFARPVVTRRARHVYRLGGWVRSDSPGATLCVRVRELGRNGRLIHATEACTVTQRGWARLKLRSQSRAARHRLVVSLYEIGAEAGDSFELAGFRVS